MKAANVLLLFFLLTTTLPAEDITQAYTELAGTVVMNDRILPVLRAGGLEYLLTVEPQEVGAQALRHGLALIVKGMVTTIVEAGQPTRLLLRPYEVTIRGQTIAFRRLAEGALTPWEENVD